MFILARQIVSVSNPLSEAISIIEARKALTFPFVFGLPDIPTILYAIIITPGVYHDLMILNTLHTVRLLPTAWAANPFR